MITVCSTLSYHEWTGQSGRFSYTRQHNMRLDDESPSRITGKDQAASWHMLHTLLSRRDLQLAGCTTGIHGDDTRQGAGAGSGAAQAKGWAERRRQSARAAGLPSRRKTWRKVYFPTFPLDKDWMSGSVTSLLCLE